MATLHARIIRHFNQGNATGGHAITDDLAFACPIPCAAVCFTLGKEEVWLTRDEAVELADALKDAAYDG
jgi:hypothetical protein